MKRWKGKEDISDAWSEYRGPKYDDTRVFDQISARSTTKPFISWILRVYKYYTNLSFSPICSWLSLSRLITRWCNAPIRDNRCIDRKGKNGPTTDRENVTNRNYFFSSVSQPSPATRAPSDDAILQLGINTRPIGRQRDDAIPFRIFRTVCSRAREWSTKRIFSTRFWVKSDSLRPRNDPRNGPLR